MTLWFLVGLAGEISSEVKRSMQDVGQGFTKHLANLSIVISNEGISQVIEVVEGNPSKFRNWIKSIEKYLQVADVEANQTKKLVYQRRMLLVIIYNIK